PLIPIVIALTLCKSALFIQYDGDETTAAVTSNCVFFVAIYTGIQVLQARINHQGDDFSPRPQLLCHLNRGDDIGSGRGSREDSFFPGEAPSHVLSVLCADRQDVIHKRWIP